MRCGGIDNAETRRTSWCGSPEWLRCCSSSRSRISRSGSAWNDRWGVTFVHNLFSVQFFYDRMPLYIIAMYPVFGYIS